MESTQMSLNFYEYFNELNSSGDTSYFADAYRAIEPLDDEEDEALERFKQMLSKYNSSKVFDYIAHALWKNVPFVYVPKDEIHVDLIEELLKYDFSLTIAPDGVYFTFLNKYDQKDRDKSCSLIMNMLDRAFTTRTMLRAVFHKILDRVLMRIGLLQYDELKFDVNSYYINPVVISNIFSEVTHLHSYTFNQTLVIDIDKSSEADNDDTCVPALFSSIENYSMLTEAICSDLMLEATERKRNKMVWMTNPYISRAMFYELQQNGFDCKKSDNNDIFVDWTNGGKKNTQSFAYRCWMRYNTVTYYRVCVSTVTRALRKDPDCMAVIFPAPKNPIDEDFFIKYFNKRQSERCYPIEVDTSRERKFMVYLKTFNPESVKS